LDETHHIEYQGHDDDMIKENILPHKDKGMISYTRFQVFELCDASFDDSKSEEFSKKPLNLVNFSFDEEHDDHIDDFLHIGKHK